MRDSVLVKMDFGDPTTAAVQAVEQSFRHGFRAAAAAIIALRMPDKVVNIQVPDAVERLIEDGTLQLLNEWIQGLAKVEPETFDDVITGYLETENPWFFLTEKEKK